MNDILIRVDEAGRIIIPLKVRKQYNINKNDILLLTTISNGFKLQKEDIFYKYQNFFSKLKTIENSFNLGLLVASSEKIIYTSKTYENFKNRKISNEVKQFLNNNQKGYNKNFKVVEDEEAKEVEKLEEAKEVEKLEEAKETEKTKNAEKAIDNKILPSCYYMTLNLDSFTKCVLFITFSEEYKKEISLISELLS